MQKLVMTFFVAMLFVFTAMAQEDRKVAVFDPAGQIDAQLRAIVREEISSIIVNTNGYTVLERQLIDRVLEEQRLQAGGLVDDNQIVEMGKLMGANLAFVTTLATLGNNYFVSVKMIDVQTAQIERQSTAQTQQGTNDLLHVVRNAVRENFGLSPLPAASATQQQTGSSATSTTPASINRTQPAQQSRPAAQPSNSRPSTPATNRRPPN